MKQNCCYLHVTSNTNFLQSKPLSSSTPGYGARPTARRPVHDLTSDAVVSPIKSDKSPSASPHSSPHIQRRKCKELKEQSRSSSDLEHSDYDDKYQESKHGEGKIKKAKKSVKQVKSNKLCYVGLFAIIISIMCYLVFVSNNNTCTLEGYKNTDIFGSLYSGISEMKKYDKPSVFLLLYKNGGEETLEKILYNISTHVNCVLLKDINGYESAPIVLTAKELHLPEFREDYGIFINKYRSELAKKNVMIIKNLDEIPSSVVGAFHSICDEYSPLVKQSVIVFTIKVEDFPEKEEPFVETMLRSKWHDLKEDHFEPLFARLSGMILKIDTED